MIRTKFARKRQRGAAMSEYMIIVALVAVAGIGLFAGFGDVLQAQMAGLSRELAGQQAAPQITDAQAKAAVTVGRSTQADGLATYNANTNGKP